MRTLSFIFILIMAGALAGCGAPSPSARADLANALAGQRGWQPFRIDTEWFTFAAYAPLSEAAYASAAGQAHTAASVTKGDTLTVYIEGDGLAWISRSQVSPNPTPADPTALKLALKHPSDMAAYLARPCQYVNGPDARHCSSVYWTDKRFAPEVVASVDEALDRLKALTRARRLALVGYSGGGAVAALVAARRTDVDGLITIAGNLDTSAWTAHHGVRPLAGSLNPADAWRNLQDIPQVHFVGGEDRIIPKEIVQSYLDRYPASGRPLWREVPGFDHHCCWERQWPALLEQAVDIMAKP